ncbi:hypothetical protein AAFF_G00429910 [Aldrovandia affinis]|uniref:Uncharacterized protein n=1 Tax=Aldrovandia affinis TaxID=143900 RepID=A0AAD7S8U6_9TELE|nr:hypothetical protein AAFF_G00429910 [Aldrovandia affinis]
MSGGEFEVPKSSPLVRSPEAVPTPTPAYDRHQLKFCFPDSGDADALFKQPSRLLWDRCLCCQPSPLSASLSPFCIQQPFWESSLLEQR